MSGLSRARLAIAIALSIVAALALPVSAQTNPAGASLRGAVRSPDGAPIPFAHVSVADVAGVADSAGRFSLTGLPSGNAQIVVRRIGFTPKRVDVQLAEGRADSIHVVLAVLPTELAGITTEATTFGRMADFERHRTNGQGIYLDRAELEKRKTPILSEVLRRVPGVRIGTDRYGRTLLRMGRASNGKDCPPDFWIDGVRAQYLGVDDVPVSDIEALEVYRGPSGMPPEFNALYTSAQCGAIIIWTRVPG